MLKELAITLFVENGLRKCEHTMTTEEMAKTLYSWSYESISLFSQEPLIKFASNYDELDNERKKMFLFVATRILTFAKKIREETKAEAVELLHSFWRFDNNQQPLSSWHEKQDYIRALERNK